jgi:hypothetical protein
MTDINGTVVGIQGNPVDPESPTDGYVLTWDGDDGYWVPRPVPQPSTGLRKEYFTSNDTWVCPDGVTNILVIGAGGGGGGAGGNADGAGGGGASIQSTVYVSVVPGNSYSITIGAGGNGSAGASSGSDGSDTIFGSNLAVFTGASGAGEALTQNPGVSVRETEYPSIPAYEHLSQPGSGGFGGLFGSYLADDGVRNLIGGFAGGVAGSQVSGHGGGGGGAAGPQGSGGAGGNGSTGTGAAGSSAAANTGAGGGGGGGGTGTSAGGDGGSGYMYIIY